MKKRILITILAIIIFIITITSSSPLKINFGQAIDSIFNNQFIITAFVVGSLLQIFGHILRAYKHSLLLDNIRPTSVREIFKGQMIGFMFNTFLPFRIGELFRAHYIAKGVSISRSAVFATILFERLIDLVAMIFIGLFVIVCLKNSHLNTILITLLISFIILGFVLYTARCQKKWLLRIIYKFSGIFNIKIRDRIRFMCWSSIYMLKNSITKKIMPKYLFFTLLMWFVYLASTLSFVCIAFPEITIDSKITSSIAAFFGVSIPSGPAYLGSFQNIFTSIVNNLSMTILHDSFLTLYLWMILIAPTTILGLYYAIRPQIIYSEKQSDVMTALKNKLFRDIDITTEFSLFLDSYFKGNEINRILTTEEIKNNFQIIKTFTGGSNALTVLAWQDEKMVVKKITLKQYQEKLSAQYEWLKERKKFPQIAGAIKEYTDNPEYYAIDIEYREEYIPFFDIIHSSTINKSAKTLIEVCKFMNDNIYKPQKKIKQTEAKHTLDKYINTKIIGKIVDSANINTQISNLLSYETININGKEFTNLNQVIQRINNNPNALNDLEDIVESPIHGDLTIDNLIVNQNEKNDNFVILDPNNENAISDPIVDYAKLMQSLHSGYEFLRTMPSCEVIDNSVYFKEVKSNQYEALYSILDEYLQKNLAVGKYRAVLFHEAVHYCRMLTYRCEINPDSAAAFYSIAVRLFNDFINQYEK